MHFASSFGCRSGAARPSSRVSSRRWRVRSTSPSRKAEWVRDWTHAMRSGIESPICDEVADPVVELAVVEPAGEQAVTRDDVAPERRSASLLDVLRGPSPNIQYRGRARSPLSGVMVSKRKSMWVGRSRGRAGEERPELAVTRSRSKPSHCAAISSDGGFPSQHRCWTAPGP